VSFAEEIVRRARGNGARLILPEGEDPRIREAAAEILRRGVADEILMGGDENTLPDVDGLRALDPAESSPRREVAERLAGDSDRWDGPGARDQLQEPLYLAAALVRFGRADGLVAGARHTTGEVLRAALTVIGTAPDISLASSSFVMDFPGDGSARSGRFLFTDAGVVPDPDPADLAAIADAAVGLHRTLMEPEPRVAFLSFSTHGSAEHPRAEKMRRATELFRTRRPGVCADGELQGDAALVPEVARRKAPGGELEGRANILVFPDLDAGNIAYKLVERLAGAGAYGPLLQGIGAPVNDLSRGCSVKDVVTVAAVTAIQGQTPPTEK